MEKLLLTPAEAAVSLGIGRSKLYELLSAGVITSIRIGNCRRIPTFALDAFVADLAEGRQPCATASSVGPAA